MPVNAEKYFMTHRGIDAMHKEELNIRRVLHQPIPTSALFEQSFWVVSIAQLVEVTDGIYISISI